MLNRSDVLKRLIELRKSIYRKELMMDNPPSLEDVKIRKEMDKLIMEIIGDGYTEEDREHIDNVLLKAICDDIPLEVAMVAIREIVMSYFQKQDKSDSNQNEESSSGEYKARYYQKGYS